MRNFFLVSCLLFTVNNSFSQVVIQGKVLNRNTKEPIAYVNIGIAKTNVGTLSNPDGSFSILIPKKHLADTLFFSALGFSGRKIPIQMLTKSNNIIRLHEKATLLNEVVVHERKASNKIYELGNRVFRGGVLEEDTLYAGRSVSLLIDNKNLKSDFQFPVYLQKARLRIFRNNLKAFKFRIRINDVDSLYGWPGKDLLQQSRVVESTMKNGWLEFNLSDLKFIVSKPFFITFEQILDLSDRKAVASGYQKFMQQHPDRVKYDTIEFEGKKVVRQMLKRGGIDLPGTFIGISNTKAASERFISFVREASFGDWTKVRGILTATVTLSNQAIIPKEQVRLPCSDKSLDCIIEKTCKEFLDETGMAGIQIGAAVGGKIKLLKSFGYADIESKTLVTDSTKFRIASITKSVSAAALAKLVSENKIDLDTPIQKYLPQFPVKKYPITTRQLAGHLAGFRDYISVTDLVHQEHYDNATQALKVFENDTLLFKPGSKFLYSFFSWSIIGAIIESISQKDYLTYMNENVFAPMQLRNTCGDNVKVKITNRSKFYDATGEENEFGDLSYKYSAGGLLSTSEDLVKFGNVMLHSISKAEQELLFTSQKTLDGTITGYGLGWYVGVDKNGHRYWHHSGDSFSNSSHLLIYPDDDLVVAFLANGQEAAAFDIQKLASLFYTK